MACVECRELLPLTAEERESFHAYAEANRTEPDGTESQWANHTVRALAELERRVAECRELREALRMMLAAFYDRERVHFTADGEMTVMEYAKALLSRHESCCTFGPLNGNHAVNCNARTEPEPEALIDHEFEPCGCFSPAPHWGCTVLGCGQPRAAHRGGKS